jgi:hypothetical protein
MPLPFFQQSLRDPIEFCAHVHPGYVVCDDGKCVESLDMCSVANAATTTDTHTVVETCDMIDPEKPFTCKDGSCAADESQCCKFDSTAPTLLVCR